MLVKVEQKHIDAGIKANYQSCALVLAVKDATGAEVVYADDFSIEWGSKTGEFHTMKGMATPMTLQVFMDNYDAGNKVEPFEFLLLEEY